jgi:hypothetical protein
MSQYKNLFQSTRIPAKGEDQLQVFPDSKHIVVQYKTKFFKFDVLRADGSAVPDSDILANIDAILTSVSQDQDAPAEVGVGLLTTLPRDTWAQARAQLMEQSKRNAANLHDIGSALFMVKTRSAYKRHACWTKETLDMLRMMRMIPSSFDG